MNTKERHIKENEEHRNEDVTSDVVADKLRADGKKKERHDSIKINKLWLWLGVIVLIILLVWWLYIFVIADDVEGDGVGMLMNVIDNFKLLS